MNSQLSELNALKRVAWLQPPILIGGLVCASLALYLGLSAWGGYIGFPLDDAWIHQTYARNLAQTGQLAFEPGQPSAGSTSPLWSGLIAVGYLLRIEPRVWTYLLGAVLLGLNAWLAQWLSLKLWPEQILAARLVGVGVALEWHLNWAMASGMETLLFAALALAGFAASSAWWAGVAVGLSVWARPDGLTLLPFVLLNVLTPELNWRALLKSTVGFGFVFGAYLLLNFALSGTIWPNTFYAKQAEYAILRELPLWTRLVAVGQLPFIGAQALLLPGLFFIAWRGLRQRHWKVGLMLGWVTSFILAYVLRLPVTYQHGRYLIPIIPLVIVLGVGGTAALLRPADSALLPRVLSRAWLAALALLTMVFWVIGATVYQRDVQIIESEMVATARWVNANTAPHTLIAAHDIGALGYFGGRRLLDLAGLVSPEVIPFIRDEAQLQLWLDQRQPDLLITFPLWYPTLTASLEPPLFRTDAPFSPRAGGENMAVYRWSK